MKSVRAKFTCGSVENFGGSKTAKLRAVTSNTGENKDFTQYTPNGQVEIMINSDAPASEFFEPGKSYYLDFTEAPEN